MSHVMRRNVRRALWAMLVAILPEAANADPITVDFAGDRALTLAIGESPRRDCSLREAFNNADNANRLNTNGCAAGTGLDTIEFASGISEVKLDTGQFGVLSIKKNTTLTVRGHSYTNKVVINGANKGGILDIDNSNAAVRFENIRFVAGRRDGGGGAILHKGGTLVLSGCRFDANNARNGGALTVTGADTRVFIDDCVFWANVASGSLDAVEDGSGGAIQFLGGSAVIGRTAFAENFARLAGGAIDCHSAGSMEIHGSLVANENGGSNNSVFNGNSTILINHDLYGSAGGGAIATDCNLVVTDTRFENNDSPGKGGAVYVRSGSTEAYFHRVAFENNRAIASEAPGGLGGAAEAEGRATFNRVSAVENSANRGDAFALRDMTGLSYAHVQNSSLLDNDALDGDGAGIWVSGPVGEFGVVIVNTTLDENTGSNTLFLDSNINDPVIFENNILQATNGTRGCGGTVDAGTLDPGLGGHSIQFDFSAVDSCANGVAGQQIPKRDANFLVHGATMTAFPYLRYSSLNEWSSAAILEPGASGIICRSVGVTRPPGWVSGSYGTDQIGRRRDATHCTRGAVEALPVIIIDF